MRTLMSIPGIGPIISSAMVAAALANKPARIAWSVLAHS